ncbi:hypothetical protein [Dyella acidisoli]|uniref:Uncharacterized protein n=1 Tax=Dyella acidisoli TaxID=1867834 RepID=A0ABQ5XWX9_9GAMM|nr:hypothetical protein [Dyella acidisoli]GLQ95031.1 hypothetical protein GCM10007901_39840 [Dyella acidisoli]
MKPAYGWIAILFLLACAAHAQANIDCSTAKTANPANATYTIEGDTVTLVNGAHSQPAAPGSHTVHETRLIKGMQTCGEFDGKPVVVVLLSDDPGGSGTFIYMAAVGQDGHSYPSVLLGDRVKPKSIVVEKDLIVVTYLDRAANEPMASSPTMTIVRRFGLQGEHLVDQP